MKYNRPYLGPFGSIFCDGNLIPIKNTLFYCFDNYPKYYNWKA